MIKKLVTSKSVIAKVIADLNIKDDNIRITDIRQWISEAVEKIGAITQMEHRVVELDICQYQVKMPCDLHSIGQIAYGNGGESWMPIKKTTSSFGVRSSSRASRSNIGCGGMYIHDAAIIPLAMNLFNYTTELEAYEKINSDPNIKQTLGPLLNQFTEHTNNGRSMFANEDKKVAYDIKPGWIVVNRKEGKLKIAYAAIPTDEDGMPLIPDNQAYSEAIYWYIVMKMKYPEYLNGTIRQEVYYDMRRSWSFYCKQAYAEAMMPTTGELESIKNIWTKLYPEINEQNTFYSYVGDQQVNY
jgi:hypothetical protein